MAMSNKNKQYLSSPLVVSTDCSTFKSFYLTCRRSLSCSKSSPLLPANPISNNPTSLPSPTNLHSPNCLRDGRAAAQAYFRRARQLELELIQLNKWINIEKNLRDCIDHNYETHLAKLDRERTSKDLVGTELVRLVNGGYIHDIKKISRPWRRLTMQVSAPAIVPAETGSNVLQVLHRMASMGTSKLSSWLHQSMPMDEICCNRIEEIKRSPVSLGFEKGFMEAITLGAMEKMEILVLEGLRIQMGAKGRAQNKEVSEKREEKAGECVVLMMLIQLRDEEKKYEAVGEIMIGLVEASVAEVEENGFLIEGVHVAGMHTGFKENKQFFQTQLGLEDGKILGRKRQGDYLWSLSVRGCEGRCSCSCWECVRNLDIVFAS